MRRSVLTRVFIALFALGASTVLYAVPSYAVSPAQICLDTPSSAVTSVDFGSSGSICTISGTWDALQLILHVRSTGTVAKETNAALQFNNDTTAGHYAWQDEGSFSTSQSDGGSASASLIVLGGLPTLKATNNPGAFMQTTCWITNYFTQNYDKIVTCTGGYTTDSTSTGVVTEQITGVWRPGVDHTVTDITMFPTDGSSFDGGSIFELYGY